MRLFEIHVAQDQFDGKFALHIEIHAPPSFLDPYVKIYLMNKDQRISKKKTHVKKRTLNPVFNESFVFDLPRTENGLADIQLEFALLDWDRVTKNEVGLNSLENILI